MVSLCTALRSAVQVYEAKKVALRTSLGTRSPESRVSIVRKILGQRE